jgi:enoyl-CoA hydratase
MQMTEQPPILYGVNGPVARITLNRPEHANAQDVALLDGLENALRHAADDDQVRVVVLAGNGKHFSAGHDLKELSSLYEGISIQDRYRFELRRYFGYAMAIRDLPKPVVASVQGACVAGGLLLAGMCDLIVAAENAYFADPVVHFGTPGVEVQMHSWRFGDQLARDLLYTGRRLPAEEALARGVIARVVPLVDLEGATHEIAARIAEADPFALQLTKRTLNRAQDIQGYRVAADAAFDAHQLSHALEGQALGADGVSSVKAKIAES